MVEARSKTHGFEALSVALSFCAMAAAATPPTPEPPAAYVIPGRTYDPNEALNPPMGSGAQYHVSLTGNDGNLGTAAQPFRTIQRGMDALQNGGDTVLIHGGFYRERVSVMFKNAPAGNPFIIRPFGDGEVIVDGSTAVSGWMDQGGNVYMAHPGFDVTGVVVDNQPLYKERSLGALQVAPSIAGVPADFRYFYDGGSKNVYVRVAGGSPASRDVGVLQLAADDTGDGVYLYSSNNFYLYGLTVRFSSRHGMSLDSDNVRVERCKVVFNTWTGLTSGNTGVQYIKNYVYFNFMISWPHGDNGFDYGGWGDGMAFQGGTHGLMQGNITQKNGGEGMLSYLGGGDITYRDNVSADNWSVSFYIDNLSGALEEGNVAICHPPNPADAYNTGGDMGQAMKNQRAMGYMLADENYGTGAHLANVVLRNNISINCRKGIEDYPQAPGSALKNITIVNNTILVPTDRLVSANYTEDPAQMGGISLPYNDGLNAGTVVRNNLIMGGDAQTWVMRSIGDGNPMPNLFQGVTIDHNLFYNPANPKPFLWGDVWGQTYTWAQWQALAGAAHGAGDVTADPKLQNAGSFLALDKKPQAGSPALDAGVATTSAPMDFLGVARPQGAGFDMGAFEGAGGPPDATPPARLKGLRFQ